MTTFSLRVAAKTTTSAISSGVNGSMPLVTVSQAVEASQAEDRT